MNISAMGASAATAAQQAQAKEPMLMTQMQTVSAPEHGRVGDIVEINPSRSSRSALQRDNSVGTMNMQAQMLRRMAERIIKEQYSQGNHLFMLFYGNKAVQLDPSLRPESFIPEYVPAQHQQAVVNAVEYYSPAHTAGRILHVAEDIAGGADTLKQNPVMTDIFRNAVGAAFISVQSETGGILPPMTQDTYEVTMQGFNDFKVEAPGVQE
jgi:hypothetical protein